MALLAVEQAIEQVLATVQQVPPTETLPLLQLTAKVLAEDIVSSIDVPPQDNSAMDGYAISFVDAEQSLLPVSQRIPAGHVGSPLTAGTAARIFTGAEIPANADTIIIQENTELRGDSVAINDPQIKQGQHVRPRGQDIARGAVVLAKGHRLQPQDIGLLASIGIKEAKVYRAVKVAVLSTGDELVEPGETLKPGQIYNSNRYLLASMLNQLACEVVDAGIVADDLVQTQSQLERLADQVDVIISSGGVSVGEEDHVKAAVESLGELSLWKLNIKPGKPLAFGRVKQTAFIGLPGNPTSSFVTFCLLARPYVLRRAGCENVAPVTVKVCAGFSHLRAGSRQEYLRVRVENGVARKYDNQSSGVLMSTSWANGLAVIKPQQVFEEGEMIEVVLLSELLG